MRPPEAFCTNDGHAPLEGRSLDIWCIGWMVIDSFTRGYLNRKIPEGECSWMHEIYPTIYRVLKVRITIKIDS